MNHKPLILVTNDDGITAKGILTLIDIMSEIGDVIVVAPDKPQSAMGHAITINNMLQLNKISNENDTIIQYSCSGTPADCVKIAVSEIMHRKPDLCVSGINHGSNSSINVIYSGTMSAAVEAGIEGIQSIGFSLLDFDANANFEHTKPFVKNIVNQVLKNKLPKGIVLNVNIPKLSDNEIKGIKICRQANAQWVEKFDKRQSPFGKDYYWLTGTFTNFDINADDTDEWALAHNYISIVPVHFDMTAHQEIENLRKWDF